MAFKLSALVLAAGIPVQECAHVVALDRVESNANPIRKVVTMLQKMSTTITEEGKKEEALMGKFTCYCKNGKGDLENSIAAAEAKGPALTSDIESAEGQKTQLDADLKQHQADRASAKASISNANAIREKDAGAFAASKAEHTSNIAAVGKAVKALEKGMAGSFLQTTTAKAVQTLIVNYAGNINDADRQDVLSFLSGSQGSKYSPASGQITGILKQIGDDMTKSLADETSEEETAISDHGALVAAKSKEVAAHTKAIEEKSIRAGETAVHIVEMKNDLTDTQEALMNDKKFLDELDSSCDTKAAEWAERQSTRSQELLALAETIKVLNDDDALELFKKAVPGRGASLVQLSGSGKASREKALKVLRAARGAASPQLDFITLALQGKGGFDKVTKMIDAMVENLAQEQKNDDSKQEYCGTSFDQADDKKKALETTSSDEAAAIATAEDSVAKFTDEIKALTAGIAELDKSVAEATEQRKQEHADYSEMMALDSQAKELLGFAKNRLNKFYNPKLYVAPPKKELTREGRIASNFGASFVQVSAHTAGEGEGEDEGRAAPGPAPEVAFGGSKSQENTGVVAMIDLIVKDLDKEMTEGETSEKDSQKDYETMMVDAKSKRASDSKALGEKEGAKANAESEAQAHTDEKDAATKELAAHAEYTHGLHAECDWLMEHHQARKDARASEVDSLKNAKAVLAGADYSLVQTSRHGFLRGA